MEDPQQVVIVTATGIVLRAGFCDFAADGTFDPDTETILTSGVDFLERAVFDPPPPDATWTWNGVSFMKDQP